MPLDIAGKAILSIFNSFALVNDLAHAILSNSSLLWLDAYHINHLMTFYLIPNWSDCMNNLFAFQISCISHCHIPNNNRPKLTNIQLWLRLNNSTIIIDVRNYFPPASLIAFATPPPCFKWPLAALTMQLESSYVMSPFLIETLTWF
jgi:hypothetical protein